MKSKIIYETQKQHTNLYFLQWQAANFKKKKKERGQRKRIVTKKEHNCTQVKEKNFNTCAQFYQKPGVTVTI